MTDYISEIREYIDLTRYQTPVEADVVLLESEIFEIDDSIEDLNSIYNDIEDLKDKLVAISSMTDSEEYNTGYEEALHYVANNLNRILSKYHNERHDS